MVIFVLVLTAGQVMADNNSGAAFSTWPDTGQTKCYDNTVEIPCPASGQPFHGQDAQYNGPVRSYTLLGGGTMVQDNVTGLIWEMKTSSDGVTNYNTLTMRTTLIPGMTAIRLPTVAKPAHQAMARILKTLSML